MSSALTGFSMPTNDTYDTNRFDSDDLQWLFIPTCKRELGTPPTSSLPAKAVRLTFMQHLRCTLHVGDASKHPKLIRAYFFY